MEILTTRPLRLSGNPGGQINIKMDRHLLVSDDLAKEMIERGMAKEIKPEKKKKSD